MNYFKVVGSSVFVLLLLMVQMVSAQDNEPEEIFFTMYRSQESLTLHFPGNQTFSFTGIRLDIVKLNGEIEGYILEEFPNLTLLSLIPVTAPACIHFERQGTESPLPLECQAVSANARYIQILSNNDVFWADIAARIEYPVLAYQGTTLIGQCLPGADECPMSVTITPQAATIPPTTAPDIPSPTPDQRFSGGDANTTFSRLFVDETGVTLLICATELTGRTVYAYLWAEASGAARISENFEQQAENDCVTFEQMTTDILPNIDYYSVASLTPLPGNPGMMLRDSCFEDTDGEQLCDTARLGASNGAQPIPTNTPAPVSRQYPCDGQIVFGTGGMLNAVFVQPLRGSPAKPPVQRGSAITILATVTDFGEQWYQINYDSARNTGWILAEHVVPTSSCPQ